MTAAFILAWACEAAQVDIARGVVVAAVAFVAILPEYIVEVHFAFTGRADYVTANLTGASRLLLGCLRRAAGGGGPCCRAAGARPSSGRSRCARAPARARVPRSLALRALRGALTGRLTLLDALVWSRSTGSTPAAPRANDGEEWRARGRRRRAGGAPRRRAAPLGARADGVRRRRDPADRRAVRRRGARHRRARRDQPVPAAAVGRADRHRGPELVVASVLLTHGRGGRARRCCWPVP